jgi:hypothetical protein
VRKHITVLGSTKKEPRDGTTTESNKKEFKEGDKVILFNSRVKLFG